MSAKTFTGAQLRAVREELGLRQVDLATLLGVAQETISRWETGAIPLERPGMLRWALEGLRSRAAVKVMRSRLGANGADRPAAE